MGKVSYFLGGCCVCVCGGGLVCELEVRVKDS